MPPHCTHILRQFRGDRTLKVKAGNALESVRENLVFVWFGFFPYLFLPKGVLAACTLLEAKNPSGEPVFLYLLLS